MNVRAMCLKRVGVVSVNQVFLYHAIFVYAAPIVSCFTAEHTYLLLLQGQCTCGVRFGVVLTSLLSQWRGSCSWRQDQLMRV